MKRTRKDKCRLSRAAKNTINSPHFIPLILFCLAMCFFPLRGVSPSPDSSWYLSNAMGIYKNCDVNSLIIRRPIFPLMIAVSFRIFGPSVQSGFFVVRMFFILNVLICYFIGAKLYNKATGLAFSLLVFTSFVVNEWSSFLLLDNILPFFVLLFMVLVYLALEKSKYLYFVLCGITLGIALLVKGVIAVMFVPLPICLLMFREYRTLKNIKGIGLAYLVFILIISPWIYSITFGNAHLRILLGPLADFSRIRRIALIPSASEFSDGGSKWRIFSGQLAYLEHFIHEYISRKFVLSRLFFPGLIYSFYCAIWRKNRATTLLLCSVFLFLPIILVVGITNIRVGQVMILYFLLYLMSANLLINFPREVIRSRVFKLGPYRLKNVFLKISTMLIVSTCLFLQIFIGVGAKRTKNFYALITGRTRRANHCFSFWKGGFNVGGWANETVNEASTWIMENIPYDANLLCQWHYRTSIDFFTECNYKLVKIEKIELTSQVLDNISMDKLGKPLFIWTRKGAKKVIGNRFSTLFEDSILKQINANHIDYVIITFRRNFLSLYFENNPNFTLAKTFSGGKIKIYQVKNLPVIARDEFPVRFGSETYKYLRRLCRQFPQKYEEEKRNLERALMWPDDEVTRFFSFVESGDQKGFWGNYERVEERKIY